LPFHGENMGSTPLGRARKSMTWTTQPITKKSWRIRFKHPVFIVVRRCSNTAVRRGSNVATLFERREVLQKLAFALTAGAAGLTMIGQGATPSQALGTEPILEPGAEDLRALMERLAKAPRRRDFKTVEITLTSPEQWDCEAIAEVMAYRPAPKQVWDNTAIESPWLEFMRNALNVQIWSFNHPNFLTVSVTRGSALLALYDDAMWAKYKLSKLAGDAFKTNTLTSKQSAAFADPENFESPAGVCSPESDSIPALMCRGVVFMACHNAIWEHAGKLYRENVNPDKLSHDALAADLTDHLVDGVVLTPGGIRTLHELQQVGFYYAE
jgi:intracellular sulfur oxidation DsrE/DsrF family protein